MTDEIKEPGRESVARGIKSELSEISFWGLIATIALMRSCHHQGRIADSLERNNYAVQVRDVIGSQSPEKFYDVDGQRVYLEVDGTPVESYFAQPITGGQR